MYSPEHRVCEREWGPAMCAVINVRFGSKADIAQHISSLPGWPDLLSGPSLCERPIDAGKGA